MVGRVTHSSEIAARARPMASTQYETSDRHTRGSSRCVAEGRLPALVDITTVADHLGVSVRHVRRLVAERRIPFLKWGNLLRFDPAAIAEWLEEARISSGRPGALS